MSKTDYLKKISNARSINQIATYVRALGLQVVAGLRYVYADHELINMIAQYEIDAIIVERCDTVQQAKQALRDRSYFRAS